MSATDALVARLVDLDRPLLVALDVDGTISPIVREPDRAEIPTPMIAILQGLAETPGVVLALITGRDLASLRRMENLEGIWRSVEHGGVVLAPGQSPKARTLTSAQRDALRRFRLWIGANASDAFIEHKPQAIAMHVRGIAVHDPERAERLMNEADKLARRLGLNVRRGKAVREAEVVAHDKGRALGEILERSGAKSVFFVGDDLTDVPAIDFATSWGIGAFVRSSEQRSTPPRFAVVLDGVDQVSEVLQKLLAHLRH